MDTEYMNKMQFLYTTEYYSSIERNEILIHDTTWVSLENMLSERSQIQKTIACFH